MGIFNRKLSRAINRSELNELLAKNNLASRRELAVGNTYAFFVHKDTIWVDSLGRKRWSLPDIAIHEKDKCGVIMEISIGRWSPAFEENLTEPGKFYCRKNNLVRGKVILV